MLCFLYVADREFGLFITTNCKRDLILYILKRHTRLFCSSLVISAMLFFVLLLSSMHFYLASLETCASQTMFLPSDRTNQIVNDCTVSDHDI